MEAEAEDQEEEENWDATSDELSSENLVTPPTDYSGIPTPEEEEEGLAAAEASLPTQEDDEGVWFRCPSPCWEQATYAQRADMEKVLPGTRPRPRLCQEGSHPRNHLNLRRVRTPRE